MTSHYYDFVMYRFPGMRDKDTDTDTLHRRWGGNEAMWGLAQQRYPDIPDPSSCHPDIDQEQQSPWPGDIYSSVPVCVCKLTISSGPSETNSRSRETRDLSLMSCVECGQQLNNLLRSILVTPGLMPRLVKMLKYTVFWYFTNIPPRGSILPQLIRGAEAGTESQIFTKLKLDTVHTPAQANDSNDDNDSNDQSA